MALSSDAFLAASTSAIWKSHYQPLLARFCLSQGKTSEKTKHVGKYLNVEQSGTFFLKDEPWHQSSSLLPKGNVNNLFLPCRAEVGFGLPLCVPCSLSCIHLHGSTSQNTVQIQLPASRSCGIHILSRKYNAERQHKRNIPNNILHLLPLILTLEFCKFTSFFSLIFR